MAASSLERSIADGIAARIGGPVVARCWGLVGCVAITAERERIPVVTWPVAGGAWEWRVDGLLVASDVLERYLRDVVATMGAAQDVVCAPKLQRIAPGEQVQCTLAHGGIAFVTVRGDGSTSVEVELDPAAAQARAEVVTPARDDAMAKQSRALERSDEPGEPDDSDGSAAEVESAP